MQRRLQLVVQFVDFGADPGGDSTPGLLILGGRFHQGVEAILDADDVADCRAIQGGGDGFGSPGDEAHGFANAGYHGVEGGDHGAGQLRGGVGGGWVLQGLGEFGQLRQELGGDLLPDTAGNPPKGVEILVELFRRSNSFVAEDQAQVLGFGGQVGHALPTIAQEGNQGRGVAGHRLEVEGQLLLRQAGFFQ
ncbi:hypothetical protein D9M70_426640 [compost metagenome]